ncbi:MAG: alpha/beta hydrolase, partial [Actinomycetota bacterium]
MKKRATKSKRAGGIVALVAGAAAAGVGAGLAAERLLIGRSRLKVDPYAREPYGKVKGDRSFSVNTKDGAVLHAEEVGLKGAKRGAIFLHGYCLDRTIWHHQMLDLGGSEERRYIFYDARDHGRSVGGSAQMRVTTLASDLVDVLDESGLEEAVLVGHSMGGMTVLEFCREFPHELRKRIKGVVLANTTHTDAIKTAIAGELVGPIERRLGKIIGSLFDDQRSVRALRLRGDDLSYLIVKLFGFGSGSSPAQVEFVRRLNAVFPSPPLIEMLKGMREFDMKDALEVIDIPTLVIAGGNDRLTTVRASRHIAEKIPGARLH